MRCAALVTLLALCVASMPTARSQQHIEVFQLSPNGVVEELAIPSVVRDAPPLDDDEWLPLRKDTPVADGGAPHQGLTHRHRKDLGNRCPEFSAATQIKRDWPVHSVCSLEDRTSIVVPLFSSTGKSSSSHRVVVSDVSPLRDVEEMGAMHFVNGTYVPHTKLQTQVARLASLQSGSSQHIRSFKAGRRSTPHLSWDDRVKKWGTITGTASYFLHTVQQALLVPLDAVAYVVEVCASSIRWFQSGGYKPYLNPNTITRTLWSLPERVLRAMASVKQHSHAASTPHAPGWMGTVYRTFNTYLRPSRVGQVFTLVAVTVQYPTDWGKSNVPGRQGGIAEGTSSLLSSGPRGGLSARVFITTPMRIIVPQTTPAASAEDEYISKEGPTARANEDIEDRRLAIQNEALFGNSNHHTQLSCEPWAGFEGPYLFERRRNRILAEHHLASDHTLVGGTADDDFFEKSRQEIEARLLGSHQEVCGPTISGSIPLWLKRIVRPSIHHTLSLQQESPLELAKKHAANTERIPTTEVPPPAAQNISCEVYLPYNSLGCLRVESIYPDRPVRDLSITVEAVWDRRWFALVSALTFLSVVKPYLLSNQPLQVLATAFLGVGFIAVLLLYLLISELRKTRLGKVGIVAMFTGGGAMGYSETTWTVIWNLLQEEIYTNVYLQLGAVACVIIACIASRYFFYDKVPAIASSAITFSQVAIVYLMATHNREATLLAAPFFVSFYFRWVLNVLLVPVFIALAVAKLAAQILFFPLSVIFSLGSGSSEFDNKPRSSFTADEILPREYVRPIAAQSIQGSTAAEKFHAYNQQGSEETRKALEALAAHIRSDPAKYVSRVRDPGGIARFAGVSED